MTVTLTNNEIYNYANALAEQFQDKEVKFPIKVNFYLQKNQNEETQQFEIPPEKIPEASEKINDLFSLTQEVKIYKVNLDAFGDIELTSGQMQALLFMIKDEDE